MSKHYTSLYYHIVFATKYRKSLISESLEAEVWAKLREAAEESGLHVYEVGGHENHVHVLAGIPPDISISDAVRMMKSISTRKIRASIPKLSTFSWQIGFSAFTFGKRVLPILLSYVRKQRDHHS